MGDANQVTVGTTSRINDLKTGEELFRLDVGQRYYLNTPMVLIPSESQINSDSDLFLSARGNVAQDTSLTYLGQYDSKTGRNEKGNITLSYAPSDGKQLNFGYRYTRSSINQFDLSGQWPISRKWSGVSRLNYSVLESRSIETLMGLEYDDGCWVARIVGQRFAVAPALTTTALFLQLELTGFGRLGSNPLDLLSREIPGYTPVGLERNP
ncbi:MAG: LPS-assembly protein LptD [Limnobacter sp.]|nr:LPS-assembly protein LptD [Limnobacter sp.]